MTEFERRVERSLGSIESKLDGFGTAISDHEDRIRVSEAELARQEGANTTTARYNGFFAGMIPVAAKVAWDWLTSPHK